MDFYKEIKKLTHKQYVEIVALCGGMALLLAAAVFISSGGMLTVNHLLAAAHVLPEAQTACVFPCNNTAYTMEQLIPTQNGAAVSTVLTGSTVNWVWNAGSYGANNFLPVCYGSVYGGGWMCTIQQGSPNTNFGTCSPSQWVCGGSSISCDAYNNCSEVCTSMYQTAPSGCGNADSGFGLYLYGVAGGIVPVGYGYSGGAVPMTAPSTPGTYTYYFCSNWLLHAPQGGLSCLGTSINVVSPIVPPTVTIDAGAGPGVTRMVAAGTPITLTATFTPNSGDTITQSSIIDGSSNALPGISIAVPPTAKSVAFTPAYAGTYVFYPSVQTSKFPSWSNYGKSVTVNVTGAPPSDICTDIAANQTTLPPGCTGPVPTPVGYCIPSGYIYNGSACVDAPDVCSNIAGKQVTPPANGYTSGGSCSCNVGYALSGASCVVSDLCSNISGAQTTQPANSTQNSDGTCSCTSGYVMSAGSCVAAGVISSLTVNPIRVLKGNRVTVTWVTAHMSTCALSSLDTGGTNNLSSALNSSANPVVNSKTIYTLTCSDPSGASYSASATVNLVPQTIEQ